MEEPKTKADPGPDKNNSENKDAKPEDKSPDKKETPKPDLPAAPLELPSGGSNIYGARHIL